MSLINAIHSNNLNQIKLLLELGHDPDGTVQSPHEKQQSPLSIAYKEDRFECAKILFAYGAYPDHDVFCEIITKANYAWCELFLEHDANTDCSFVTDEKIYDYDYDYDYDHVILRTGNACSHLNYLAQIDNPEFIELFLKFGANIEIQRDKRDNGQTPLSVAAQYNAINAMQIKKNKYGIQTTDSPEKAISSKNCNVIIIATPTSFHKEQVELAVYEKKPFYCEKPLGLTLEESEEMTKLVTDSGLNNQVGLCFRYSPNFCFLNIASSDCHDLNDSFPACLGIPLPVSSLKGCFFVVWWT